MSYQNKLRLLTQEEGIILEMNAVAKLTITGMYNLIHYGKKNVITINLDNLTFDFDIKRLDVYLGISSGKSLYTPPGR